MEENIKKKITINGFSLYYLAGYFTIYSIMGCLLETIFGIATKGVIESRQSFLYGPFCAIYGIGAVVILITLRKFKNNLFRTFFVGVLVGSLVEYTVSILGEMLYNVKWWDYSNMPLNLDGRICLFFSIVWGISALVFIQYIHPIVEKITIKATSDIPKKVLKIIVLSVFLFQFVDFLVSTLAVEMFISRKVHELDLKVENRITVEEKYDFLYQFELIQFLSETIFKDENIIKAFPNLKVKTEDDGVRYFREYMPEISPYYLELQKYNKFLEKPLTNLKNMV